MVFDFYLYLLFHVARHYQHHTLISGPNKHQIEVWICINLKAAAAVASSDNYGIMLSAQTV